MGVGVCETQLLTIALLPVVSAVSVRWWQWDLMLANLTPCGVGLVPPYHLQRRSPFHEEDF